MRAIKSGAMAASDSRMSRNYGLQGSGWLSALWKYVGVHQLIELSALEQVSVMMPDHSANRRPLGGRLYLRFNFDYYVDNSFAFSGS